jgi:bacteriocin biosynthesis cyclodehydratase domain-containing protein
MTPVLPAVICLPPHHTVVPLGPGARMLGLDPDSALAIDGLPPPLAEMLDELHTAVPAHLLVARAVERGATPDAAEAVLRRLVDVGAVIDAVIVRKRAERRSASTVVVAGAGPLAVGIVIGLVLAGIGTVHTDTGGEVHSSDLGTGYVDADHGRDRLVATRDAVRRLVPGAGTDPPPLRLVPDLVVLADEYPRAARLAALHSEVVAHLPARLRDGIGVIGPLVLPGRTACLSCVELHRSACDPEWSLVAAQLAGQGGRADPSCVAATAGLATAQALAAVDGMGGGPAPTALNATLELDVVAGALVRRVWEARPECPCRAAPPEGGSRHGRATSGKGADGDTIKG